MVQKRVQKQVQKAKADGKVAMEEIAMPQFMSKSPRGTGYLFRRGVPADIRASIGKREFKFSLGGNYQAACQRCRELAVETDRQIAMARAGSAAQPDLSSELTTVIAQSRSLLTEIQEIDSDFISRLRATVIEDVLRNDREQRYRGHTAINLDEKLTEVGRVRNWAVMASNGYEIAVNGWLDMLTNTLKRNGYGLAESLRGSQNERMLLIEYASAYRDALDILEAQYLGKPYSAGASGASLLGRPLQSASSQQVFQLSAAIKEFLESLPPEKRSANEKHGFVLPAFLEVVGDMRITELRQSHVKDFLLTVQKLPPRWSDIRKKDKKSIRDLANQEWAETLALSTYEGTYCSSLRTFIKRAVADWQDVGFPTTLTTNISYLGSRTKVERKQRALRPHEIEAIFLNDKMTKIVGSPKKMHKFWLLAIELYTGARVREICQINPQHDFGEKDGISWLRITDEAGHSPDPDVIKSVKTGKPRTIPMHTELVRLGLPDYLESLKKRGARRLFPAWAPTQGDAGAAPGKWVVNYMHSIGIHGIANELGNAVRGSHTFRHTFLTHGRKNGVSLRCISGHQEKTDNQVADGYEDETVLLTLADMAARLAKLNYGVKLPAPVTAQMNNKIGDPVRPAESMPLRSGVAE